METYTREQLRERWEKAKDNQASFGRNFSAAMLMQIIPGLWEVTIFPRWFFKGFNDRKIIEPPHSAIMSRNVLYDPDSPDSEDTQEWGWFHWRYYFDTEEDCYLLKLDYNVEPGDTKPLPLVRGILDVCLLESPSSIIGKFKWRSPFLQKIPLIRRIPFIKPHRFLFYFEMKKIEEDGEITSLNKTAYSLYGNSVDLDHVITYPKGSKAWEKQMYTRIADPRIQGRCIFAGVLVDTGDGETFTCEYDISFR